jgi:hypothetical protein
MSVIDPDLPDVRHVQRDPREIAPVCVNPDYVLMHHWQMDIGEPNCCFCLQLINQQSEEKNEALKT